MTATTVVILRRYPALYISEVGGGSKGGVPQGMEGGGIRGEGFGGGGRRRVLSEVEEEVRFTITPSSTRNVCIGCLILNLLSTKHSELY